MDFSFPAQLAPQYLGDEAFAAAYEALAPEERAQIKTAIVRMIAACSECGCPDVATESSLKTLRQGYSLYERVRPADWAVIFWDGGYSGWARILAALLPAVLAGVPNILACRVVTEEGQAPLNTYVLAAMELGGQELVAQMSPDEACSLLANCFSQSSRGRAVILGEDQSLESVAAAATRLGLPIRRESRPVRIAVEGALPTGSLALVHPDAGLLPLESATAPLSAIFCDESRVATCLDQASLVLTPGHEAFWRWQDIDVAFFQEKARAIAAHSSRP